MALEFRMVEQPLMHDRVSAFFGVRCGRGEHQELAKALMPLQQVEWIRYCLSRIRAGAGREGREIYISDFQGWPDDILAIGVERLREQLIAAGLREAA